MATILSICSYPFLPAKNGGQKHIALFYKYFSRHHRLMCAGTSDNDASEAQGYEFIPLFSTNPLRYINLFYFFSLRKLIRRQRVDFILLEHPYFGWLGVLLQHFCGIKLIVRSHNIEALRWKSLGKWWWRLLWYYERMTHRAADISFFIQDDDLRYAIQSFGVESTRCSTITYGIEIERSPSLAEKQDARRILEQRYSLSPAHTLFIFNGDFRYEPNRLALQCVLDEIEPRLARRSSPYVIFICGAGVPEQLQQRAPATVIFTGYVDQLSQYLTGADAFLNPVLQGGGIKTKLVEALGYGLNAVSSRTGAIGIDPAICSGKLIVTNDADWNEFVEMLSSNRTEPLQGAAYYQTFYWGAIAERATAFIAQKNPRANEGVV